jgi:hypothetical protein
MLFLSAWTLLLAFRVAVALARGDWTTSLVGPAVLAASAGVVAWAWSTARR